MRKYGVFEWRQDGMYKAELCLKEYKSDKAAQKAADKMNDARLDEGNSMIYVSRWFYDETRNRG